MKDKIKKRYRKLIYILAIILMFLSILYIIASFLLKKEVVEESNLLNTIEIYQNEEINKSQIKNETNEIENKNTKEEIPKKTERMIKLDKIKENNTDIIGWIEIENTSINYPVLQGKDNEYYMTHNYKKEKSKSGSIFLTKDYDWNIPSSNLLIYGHNINNGTMFQELLKYSDKKFYEKHPLIRFTTVEEDVQYEIISVFKSRVYYKAEKNVFRYYFFVNAKTEEEYNNYITNAKKASLYNIDATAKYGEQLITLSTCSYHVEDGRFAVVGRRAVPSIPKIGD